MVMPDRISIFRRPILAMCADEAEVVEQVRITVIHEVAHHFGIDDDRLHELGLGLSDYAAAVPFSSKLLNEGEDIVLDLHPHWVYFIKSGLLLLVTLAIGRL